MLSRGNEQRLAESIYRHPKAPPMTVLGQRNEGFVRFLKQHASPSHQRVTAGGRIIPVDPLLSPPPFSLDLLLGGTKQPSPVHSADLAYKRTSLGEKYHQKSRSRSVSLKGSETAAFNIVNRSNNVVAIQHVPENSSSLLYSGIAGYGSHPHQLMNPQAVPACMPPFMQLPAGAVLNCMLADGAALVTFNGKLYRASTQALANGLHMVMEPLDIRQPFTHQPAIIPTNAAFPHSQTGPQYGSMLQPDVGTYSYMANPFNSGQPDLNINSRLQIAQSEYNSLRAQLVNVDKQMAMYRQEMTPSDHAIMVARRVQLVGKLDDARNTKNRLQSLTTNNAPTVNQGHLCQPVQAGYQYSSDVGITSDHLQTKLVNHYSPPPQSSYAGRISHHQYNRSYSSIDQEAYNNSSIKATHNLGKSLSPNAPPFVPSNTPVSIKAKNFPNNVMEPTRNEKPLIIKHLDGRFKEAVSIHQQPKHQVPTAAAEPDPYSSPTALKTNWELVTEELQRWPKTLMRESDSPEKRLTDAWSPNDPLFDSNKMDSKNEINLTMTGDEADELAWGRLLNYKQHRKNIAKANAEANTFSHQSNQKCKSEDLKITYPQSLERDHESWTSISREKIYDRSDPRNALRNVIRSPPSCKSRNYGDENPFAGFGLSAAQLDERERKMREVVGTEEEHEEAEAPGKGVNNIYGSQSILRKMLKSPEFSTARLVSKGRTGQSWWSTLKETTNTSARVSVGTPKALKQNYNTSANADRDNYSGQAYKAPSSLGSSNYNAHGMLPQYDTREASTRFVSSARPAQYHSQYDAVEDSSLYPKSSTRPQQFLPQYDGPEDSKDPEPIADVKPKQPTSRPAKQSDSQAPAKDKTMPGDPFALYRYNKNFPSNHHTAVDHFFRTIREEETQQMMTPW